MRSPSYEPPTRLTTTPSWLLGQAAVHAGRLVAEAFAAAGARGYQYALLSALEEFGPSSQAVLGKRCGIDRSDVVATVNTLVDRGLVERTPDPVDRRRNTITLTDAGHRELLQLDAALAPVQDELLAPLTAKERGQLVAILARMQEHHRHGG